MWHHFFFLNSFNISVEKKKKKKHVTLGNWNAILFNVLQLQFFIEIAYNNQRQYVCCYYVYGLLRVTSLRTSYMWLVLDYQWSWLFSNTKGYWNDKNTQEKRQSFKRKTLETNFGILWIGWFLHPFLFRTRKISTQILCIRR